MNQREIEGFLAPFWRTDDGRTAAKRAMGRPRDLHAVLELEVIRERRRQGSLPALQNPSLRRPP